MRYEIWRQSVQVAAIRLGCGGLLGALVKVRYGEARVRTGYGIPRRQQPAGNGNAVRGMADSVTYPIRKAVETGAQRSHSAA
jgi:hypothetical protein